MRRRIVSILLALAMVATVGTYFRTSEVRADASDARYVMDAETLPDGKIATVFIKGGSTTTNSYVSQNIVSGGALYYGVYDPVNNDWAEEIISASASEASLALSGSTPHVAYVNSDKDIAYTYKSGDAWSVPDVIDSNNLNSQQGNLYYPDLAIDHNGYANISYFDTQGGEEEDYKRPDVMYATNKTGSFVKTLLVNCYGENNGTDGGWFDEAQDPHIFLHSSIGYGVSYKLHSMYRGWASTAEYSNYTRFTNQTGTYSFKKNATLYGVCTNGTDAWELEYYDNSYNILKFGLGASTAYEISVAATVAHANLCSDITLGSDNDLCFAGITDTSAVFYQNGVTTDVTAATARCSYNRVFTVLSGNDQYLVYTGADTDNSLIFLKFDGSDISEFKVPNTTPEETPNASFEATGPDCGTLSDVVSGMKYSLDGGTTWIDITDTTVDIDSDVTVEYGIQVKQPATSPMTTDSEIQQITITKADTPELTAVQPSVIDGKGSIPTTDEYEYSTDGTAYTACSGELTDLAVGTYYVRVKAAGTVLASDAQEINIEAFVPSKEPTPETVFYAQSNNSGMLNGVDDTKMFFRVNDGEWIKADGNPVGVSSLNDGDVIQVYSEGNKTTTIDSDIQTISITKANTPSVDFTQPTTIGGKGSIETTDELEYRHTGSNYLPCEGELTDLTPGTYYVRVKASGTMLASEDQTIVIEEFVPSKEATPEAVFTATGPDSGTLTNVTAGMKYKIDENDWVDITGTTVTIESGLTACVISVVKSGNGTTTIDSEAQQITVTQADTPELTAVQPAVIDGKGSIPTTDKHEFSTDGTTYTACTGETADLAPGTYYVRTKASGNILASEPQEIEIKEFVAGKEDTPEAVFEKTDLEGGILSNVTAGMKYSLDGGTEWLDITGTTVQIASGATPENGIKVYMPGNGTTTVDSDIQTIEVPANFKVTFDSKGGSEVAPVYVIPGGKVTEPEKPTREGWTFGHWYLEGAEYNFNTAVNSDITLKASWFIGMAAGVYNKSNPENKQCGTMDIKTSMDLYSYPDSTFINFTAPEGSVSFTAKPAEGYVFVGWYKGVVGESGFVEGPGDELLKEDTTYIFDAEGIALCAVFECAGHDWSTTVKKATFEEDGYTKTVCSICGLEDTTQASTIEKAEASLEGTSFEYTGKAIEPAVTVKTESGELSSDNYTIEYSDNINAGTASVKITLKGDYYEGEKTLTFEIKGQPATPTPTEKPDEPTVTPTPTETPAKPTDEPTPTPTEAPAKPTDEPTPTPDDGKISIAKAKVEFQYKEFPFYGDPVKPAIAVSLNGKQLKGKVDFKGVLTDNDKVGTASITIVGQGKYKDEVTKTFKIVMPMVVSGKTLDVPGEGITGSSWKTSNKTILTVSDKGVITGKQAGVATVSYKADGKTKKFEVQVLYKDVTKTSDFWFEPTNALTALGVVKGYDNQTKFKPGNDCTRAQMVTFLWRLAGQPAPKSSSTKFTDIKKSDYFYKPVLWAVEQGITTGISKTKFGPQGVCTRAQTVTFLWRMAGKPDPTKSKNPFKDVKEKDYFYTATIWVSEKKIVAGYSDGTFKPQGKCLRRQMVTFLYKYDKFVNGKG
ncbi:MAG: S-layer homology domain-containing protein [Clostridiales bacterium]|nr:S-layer homology domain-containing protein [Clostridiales bacterium]